MKGRQFEIDYSGTRLADQATKESVKDWVGKDAAWFGEPINVLSAELIVNHPRGFPDVDRKAVRLRIELQREPPEHTLLAMIDGAIQVVP